MFSILSLGLLTVLVIVDICFAVTLAPLRTCFKLLLRLDLQPLDLFNSRFFQLTVFPNICKLSRFWLLDGLLKSS
jgi:hypothetical protein